jgi:proteic killer suppression protein
VIKSFVHKGLEDFFLTGSTRGIQVKHAVKLTLILDLLDVATLPGQMNFPGSGLHPLKGDLKEHWSVKVSGNWRITFRFEGEDVHLVNYIDYH